MTETPGKRQRTCIGCGTKSDKVQLHRIVRTTAGEVRYDPTGRAPGRGAYVCSGACLRQAVPGKLPRALKCKVSGEDAARVAEELEEALSGACAR